ncbi:MAG: MAPEG family protein [Rhodobacteraceae bacterium]|nr:MAPEG family protein [Paracoccaceae bacterium]
MTPLSIALIAVFLQVALTFFAIVRMGNVRLASHARKEVTFGDVALDTRNYPDSIKQFQNNVTNQFETPVLLYTVVAIAAATDSANGLVAIGAIIYVISRSVHHFIHVGTNHLRKRFNAFVVGLIGLLISWIGLGIALLW